jgi:four helix bundle protein
VARSLESLEVLSLANELRAQVQQLAKRNLVQRDLRFASQLTDAAAGVSRNIAEGFGHVRPLEFARFLFIARGSLFELREHLSDGVGRGYWTEEELKGARVLSKRTTGALNALIRYLRSEKARQAARQWEQIRGSTSDERER